jgi:hypothetical protein
MTNALETVWQDVQQEAADELVGVQGHHFLAVVVAIVLPAKGDRIVVDSGQAGVGDCHAMGISAEIIEHSLRAAKGWLRVDHPVDFPRHPKKFGKGIGPVEFGQGSTQSEFAVPECAVKILEEEAAEQAGKHTDRQEEARTAGNPMLTVRRQTTARNNAMQVGMKVERLPPSVQHGDEADLGAEMTGVGGDGAQGRGGAAKQDVIDDTLVL